MKEHKGAEGGKRGAFRRHGRTVKSRKPGIDQVVSPERAEGGRDDDTGTIQDRGAAEWRDKHPGT